MKPGKFGFGLLPGEHHMVDLTGAEIEMLCSARDDVRDSSEHDGLPRVPRASNLVDRERSSSQRTEEENMATKTAKKSKNTEPTEAELLALEKERQGRNSTMLDQAASIACDAFDTTAPSRAMVGGIFEILKNDLEGEITRSEIVERIGLAKNEAEKYGKADVDDIFAVFSILFGTFSVEEAPEQFAAASLKAKKLYGIPSGLPPDERVVDCETVVEVYDQIYGQDDLLEMTGEIDE